MPVVPYMAQASTWKALDGSGTSTPPSPSAWPDATNTGIPPGTKLHVAGVDISAGTNWHYRPTDTVIQIDGEGAIIDSVDCPGGIYNPQGYGTMTVTNSRFRLENYTDGLYGAYLGPGSTMTDCEMGGGANGTTRARSVGIVSVGTQAQPNVIRRVNVHHITHCINTGSDTSVYDSWLHDVNMGDTDMPNMDTDHTEAVFITNGQRMLFEHCSMDGGNTAVFFAQNYDHTADGTGLLTVNNCKFVSDPVRNGQWSNSAIIIENKMINGAITVTNNVFDGPATGSAYPFGVWELGYVISVPETVSTVSGNTYVDSSSADGTSSVQYTPVVY